MRLLKSLLLSSLAVAQASLHAGSYVWNGSSGQLPNQANPAMALYDESATYDPQLSGGILTLRTASNPEGMLYLQDQALSIPFNLEITATVRYVSGSTISTARSPVGIFVDTSYEVGTAIILGPSYVASVDQTIRQSATVDTSSFHDYRILFAGTSLGSSFSVYQDGAFLFSDTVYSDPGFTVRVGFGDGAGGASGVSEWKSFTHNASTVPEPGLFSMLALGSLLLGIFRVRKGRIEFSS